MGQWVTIKNPGSVTAGCKGTFAAFREAADANDYRFNSISAVATYKDRPPGPVADYGPYDHKVYSGGNYAELVTVPFVFPCTEMCEYVDYEIVYSGGSEPFKVRVYKSDVPSIAVRISKWQHIVGPVNDAAEDSPNRSIDATATVVVSCPECDPAAQAPSVQVVYIAGVPAAQMVDIADITPPTLPYTSRIYRVHLAWPDVPPNANVGAIEVSGDCRCCHDGLVQPVPLPTWVA